MFEKVLYSTDIRTTVSGRALCRPIGHEISKKQKKQETSVRTFRSQDLA